MANTIIEFAVFAIFVAAFFAVSGYSFWLRHKTVKINNDLIQAVVDKKSLEAKLLQMSNSSGKSLEQTDGFVRFLSESRDSAFTYIEDTQKKLVRVQQELGPVVEAYRNAEKRTDAMTQIIKSYDEIMELLPDNS